MQEVCFIAETEQFFYVSLSQQLALLLTAVPHPLQCKWYHFTDGAYAVAFYIIVNPQASMVHAQPAIT